MFARLDVCCALLILAQLLPANAGSRVYDGIEAEALHCAAEFSYTAQALSQRGLMSDHHRDVATRTTQYLLENYVSGSFDDKFGAFEVALARLPVDDLDQVRASVRHLGHCEKQFLQ